MPAMPGIKKKPCKKERKYDEENPTLNYICNFPW